MKSKTFFVIVIYILGSVFLVVIKQWIYFWRTFPTKNDLQCIFNGLRCFDVQALWVKITFFLIKRGKIDTFCNITCIFFNMCLLLGLRILCMIIAQGNRYQSCIWNPYLNISNKVMYLIYTGKLQLCFINSNSPA